MSSVDLKPGTKLRHKPSGEVVTLERRKTKEDPGTFLPGWWLEYGRGLADSLVDATDSDWEVLPALDSREAAVGLLIAALKEIRYDSISDLCGVGGAADAALKAWEETVEP